MKKYILIITIISFFKTQWIYSVETSSVNIIKPDKGRTERMLGDIFLGVSIGSGPTNMQHNTNFKSNDTQIIDKNMYFYNLSILAKFFLSSYSAIVLEYGLQSLRFDRRSIWKNGEENPDISERFLEQWFNRLTIGGHFLFWDIFFIQTGPSMLINYNSKTLKHFMGIEPNIRDNAGVTLQWQVGLGASMIIGYKDNGDPLMTIDFSFNNYIPVAGHIINSSISTDNGGKKLKIKANPYLFEFSLAFTTLL